jgi:hypothetical protein
MDHTNELKRLLSNVLGVTELNMDDLEPETRKAIHEASVHLADNFGIPGDCAQGIHSWVNEQGILPPDTKCTHCGELYGTPEGSGDTSNMTVQELRDADYCVIIWTPDEIGNADAGDLEDIVIERGNIYLDSFV